MLTTPRRPSRWMLVGPAAAMLLAGACGGARPPPTQQRSSGGAAIEVKLFRFQPGTLTVPAGTTVTWTNRDQILHTATAGTPEAPAREIFDGEMPEVGKSFGHTFSKPGTYPFFCARHNGMRGTVEVR